MIRRLATVCCILVLLLLDLHTGQAQLLTCFGALAPRLSRGDTGRVVETGTSHNLRDSPSTSGKLLAQMKGGTTFNVIGDRVCADMYLWYHIQSGSVSGWIAESGGRKYWLEPVYLIGRCLDEKGLRLAYITAQSSNIRVHDVETASTCIYEYLAGQEFVPDVLTWSPDGETLAFSGLVPGMPGKKPLYGLDLRTLEVRVLTTPGAWDDDHPVWSPDGKRLAFYSSRPDGGTNGLWILEGRVERRISRANDGAIYYAQFAWSPDSSCLAFVKNLDHNNWKVFAVGANGTNEVQLSDRNNGPDHQPVWSPDSQWIAYEAASGDIILVRPDGSGQQTFTRGHTPAWSPDGREVAFTREKAVFVIDVQSKTERLLTETSDTAQNPSWSPDGEFIAYVTSGVSISKLYMIRRGGTDNRLVARDFAFGDWNWLAYTWSPQS